MFRLDDRVILVTGASRGIGRATALALGKQGAFVVVGYATRGEDAAAVVQKIQQDGGKAQAMQIDVTDSSMVDERVRGLVKEHGRLDGLVANAGVAIDALLMRAKDDDLERMWQVNVRGALACARAAIRPMMRKRYGRIVFMSSVVGQAGNIGQVSYAATKAALIGMTKSLAREYASRNITVNAVAPGFVQTDMTAGLGEKQRQAAIDAVPMGRLGEPEDVAGAVVYLCSDEASYITGSVLQVNGGMFM